MLLLIIGYYMLNSNIDSNLRKSSLIVTINYQCYSYYHYYYCYYLTLTMTWVIKCPHFEHHPTIRFHDRYMVYNGYYKVMSNIPKMGHLTTPVWSLLVMDIWSQVPIWFPTAPEIVFSPSPAVQLSGCDSGVSASETSLVFGRFLEDVTILGEWGSYIFLFLLLVLLLLCVYIYV